MDELESQALDLKGGNWKHIPTSLAAFVFAVMLRHSRQHVLAEDVLSIFCALPYTPETRQRAE